MVPKELPRYLSDILGYLFGLLVDLAASRDAKACTCPPHCVQLAGRPLNIDYHIYQFRVLYE